ncbi:MAG: hypothetical protein SCJ93_04665 [Bacillota bacterium]|nr:hypothetical protein [Bacillota bacterium]
MIKKLIFLSFIPIFILLYYGSSFQNTTIGLIGILLFIVVAVVQFITKN